jgi:hypothetical protein
MDKLTSKQEQFCRNVASGMNQTDAFMSAYGYQSVSKSITANASKLATTNTKVIQRIDELKQRALEKAEQSGLIMNAHDRRVTLSEIILNADRDRDKISAIVELSKLENDYNFQVDTVNLVQLKTFSTEDLRLMIQQAKTIESDGIILDND